MRTGPLAPVTAPATRSSRRRTRTTHVMCTMHQARRGLMRLAIHIQPQLRRFCSRVRSRCSAHAWLTPYRLFDTYQLPMPRASCTAGGPHVFDFCHVSCASQPPHTGYPRPSNKTSSRHERGGALRMLHERNHACAAAGRHASISDRSETTPQSFPPAVIHTWPMLMNENSE